MELTLLHPPPHSASSTVSEKPKAAVIKMSKRRKPYVKRITILKKDIYCVVCKKYFANTNNLKLHEKTHLEENKIFSCDLCGNKFHRKQALIIHKRTHGVDTISCESCDKVFTEFRKLFQHKVKVHGLETTHFKCDQCIRTFASYGFLVLHKNRSHPNIQEKNPNRLQSNYAVASPKELQEKPKPLHSSIRWPRYDSIIKTRSGGSTKVRMTVLKKPAKHSLGETSCILNDINSENATRTEQEFEEQTADINSNPIQNTAFKRTRLVTQCSIPKSEFYQCLICGEKLKNRLRLLVHKAKHKDVNNFLFFCPVCNKTLKYLQNLQNHFNIHYGIKRYKQYHCAFCSLKYSSASRLRCHENKVHGSNKQDENPTEIIKFFTCDVCNQTINSKKQFMLHKTTHEEDTHLFCNFRGCGKSYTEFLSAKYHSNRHFGRRPFKCDFCPMQYSRNTSLYSHKRNKHEDKAKYMCCYCGVAFWNKSWLEKHHSIDCTGESEGTRLRLTNGRYVFSKNNSHRPIYEDLWGDVMFSGNANESCLKSGESFVKSDSCVLKNDFPGPASGSENDESDNAESSDELSHNPAKEPLSKAKCRNNYLNNKKETSTAYSQTKVNADKTTELDNCFKTSTSTRSEEHSDNVTCNGGEYPTISQESQIASKAKDISSLTNNPRKVNGFKKAILIDRPRREKRTPKKFDE